MRMTILARVPQHRQRPSFAASTRLPSMLLRRASSTVTSTIGSRRLSRRDQVVTCQTGRVRDDRCHNGLGNNPPRGHAGRDILGNRTQENRVELCTSFGSALQLGGRLDARVVPERGASLRNKPLGAS
jgi:hypothetical protein